MNDSYSNPRNVLLISPFFYPEKISTGKYNTFVARELIDRGFKVDVVTMFPFYPKWKIEKSSPPFDGARVYRYGTWLRFPKSQILRRLVLEVSFTILLLKHFLTNKGNHGTVILIFPPVLFNLFLSKRLAKSRTIGIIHDVQGIMAKTKNSSLRNWISTLIARIERKSYEKTDILICLSNSMKQSITSSYKIDPKKTKVFYPFISTKDIDPSNCYSRLEKMFNKDARHIVYSGALGEKQRPEFLLKIFEELCRRNSDIHCHFFSNGPSFESLKDLISSGLRNRILCHDLVDESDLSELMYRSDIQIIPQAPGTGAGAFPSKLPNLLAHGTPIFAICDENSELANILKEVKSAHTISNWNISIAADEIESFIIEMRSSDHNSNIEQNRASVLKQFEIDEFLKLCLDKN